MSLIRSLLTSCLPVVTGGVLLAAPLASVAEEKVEDNTGWYGTLKIGGTNLLEGPEFDWTIDGKSYDGDLNNPWGFSAQAGVGYDWGKIRLELAYKYSWFNNNDLSIDQRNKYGNIIYRSVGDSSLQSLLARLNYDFKISESSRFTPTVGVQGGLVCANSPDVSATIRDSRGSYKVKADGKQSCGFGYGANAGLLYKIAENLNGLMDISYVYGGQTVETGSRKVTRYIEITQKGEVLRDFRPNRVVGGTACILRRQLNLGMLDDCTDVTVLPDTTNIQKITVKDRGMNYSPFNGLNLMIGLQYFFGGKNNSEPKKVIVNDSIPADSVVVPEPVLQPSPEPEVETLQPNISVPNTPIRALW